jgi:hypothetical protein
LITVSTLAAALLSGPEPVPDGVADGAALADGEGVGRGDRRELEVGVGECCGGAGDDRSPEDRDEALAHVPGAAGQVAAPETCADVPVAAGPAPEPNR